MRKIFTLIGCLALFIVSIAQSPSEKYNTVIRFYCGTPTLSVKPLFVIDGIVKDDFDLKEIDLNNIESIEILKNAAAQPLFCSWPDRGVVVITTKTANQKTIYAKDFLTGEPLPGASIDVISTTNKKDTIHLIADSSGKVVSNKIKYGKDYELKVTNTGYKSFSSVVNSKQISSGYSVFLVTEYRDLEEVIVTSISCETGPRKNSNCSFTTGLFQDLVCRSPGIKIKMLPEEKEKEDKLNNLKVYPNPLLRSQKMNIEFTSENECKLKISLCTINGKLIVSNEYMAFKGVNEFQYSIDSKLASGIYVIQIIEQENKLIKTEKLIIQ